LIGNFHITIIGGELSLYNKHVHEAKMTNSVEIPDTQGFGAFSYLKSFLLDELYVFHIKSFHLKRVLCIVLHLKQGKAERRLGRDRSYGFD